jgi:hypothetical protein
VTATTSEIANDRSHRKGRNNPMRTHQKLLDPAQLSLFAAPTIITMSLLHMETTTETLMGKMKLCLSYKAHVRKQ